jgi:hypothetical protein
LGLPVIDHFVPFQCSTNVCTPALAPASPTAKQLVALGHATSHKVFVVPRLGLATIDHFVPFHRSTNDLTTVLPTEELPTAKQKVALRHVTPKKPPTNPFGFGVATIDHFAPFHRSTNGLNWVLSMEEFPTAKQLFVPAHEMLLSSTLDAPAGVGMATTDHLVPFHRSANDLLVVASTLA